MIGQVDFVHLLVRGQVIKFYISTTLLKGIFFSCCGQYHCIVPMYQCQKCCKTSHIQIRPSGFAWVCSCYQHTCMIRSYFVTSLGISTQNHTCKHLFTMHLIKQLGCRKKTLPILWTIHVCDQQYLCSDFVAH